MTVALVSLVVVAAFITFGAIAVLRSQRQAREYLHRQASWNDRVKQLQANRRAHHIARERLRQLHQNGRKPAA